LASQGKSGLTMQQALLDQRIIKFGQSIFDYEETQRQLDGTVRVVSVSKVPLPLEDGSTGVLCIFRDITERKQMLEKLSKAKVDAEQASRAKSRFLSVVSHEMKTPVNAIKGGLDLLASWCQEPKQQALAQTLLEASDQLLALVDDVMNTVRSDYYDVELNNQAMDVCQLTQACYDKVCMHADRKAEVDCQLLIAPAVQQLPLLDLDALRISQLINNLLDNAIKFTQSGTVVLQLDCLQQQNSEAVLQWRVNDSGCG
ncbi:unnamed protein product, partial [marine sediment metagenome]